MTLLIIEDEQLAAQKLKALVMDVLPECQVLEIIDTVEDAVQWLMTHRHPDVILSDIHLADGLCFSIYSEVQVNCPIIFTTAYEKYAIQAFEVNSIDYLLKPIQKDRLELALQKCQSMNPIKGREDVLEEVKAALLSQRKQYKTRFLCKLGTTIKSIESSSIRYFYSQDKMTFIVDANKNRLPINNTLDEIDQMLDPHYFFRINRKFIVNFSGIDEIHTYFKGRLKLKLKPNMDEDIVISTEKAPIFKSWLDR